MDLKFFMFLFIAKSVIILTVCPSCVHGLPLQHVYDHPLTRRASATAANESTGTLLGTGLSATISGNVHGDIGRGAHSNHQHGVLNNRKHEKIRSNAEMTSEPDVNRELPLERFRVKRNVGHVSVNHLPRVLVGDSSFGERDGGSASGSQAPGLVQSGDRQDPSAGGLDHTLAINGNTGNLQTPRKINEGHPDHEEERDEHSGEVGRGLEGLGRRREIGSGIVEPVHVDGDREGVVERRTTLSAVLERGSTNPSRLTTRSSVSPSPASGVGSNSDIPPAVGQPIRTQQPILPTTGRRITAARSESTTRRSTTTVRPPAQSATEAPPFLHPVDAHSHNSTAQPPSTARTTMVARGASSQLDHAVEIARSPDLEVTRTSSLSPTTLTTISTSRQAVSIRLSSGGVLQTTAGGGEEERRSGTDQSVTTGGPGTRQSLLSSTVPILQPAVSTTTNGAPEVPIHKHSPESGGSDISTSASVVRSNFTTQPGGIVQPAMPHTEAPAIDRIVDSNSTVGTTASRAPVTLTPGLVSVPVTAISGVRNTAAASILPLQSTAAKATASPFSFTERNTATVQSSAAITLRSTSDTSTTRSSLFPLVDTTEEVSNLLEFDSSIPTKPNTDKGQAYEVWPSTSPRTLIAPSSSLPVSSSRSAGSTRFSLHPTPEPTTTTLGTTPPVTSSASTQNSTNGSPRLHPTTESADHTLNTGSSSANGSQRFSASIDHTDSDSIKKASDAYEEYWDLSTTSRPRQRTTIIGSSSANGSQRVSASIDQPEADSIKKASDAYEEYWDLSTTSRPHRRTTITAFSISNPGSIAARTTTSSRSVITSTTHRPTLLHTTLVLNTATSLPTITRSTASEFVAVTSESSVTSSIPSAQRTSRTESTNRAPTTYTPTTTTITMKTTPSITSVPSTVTSAVTFTTTATPSTATPSSRTDTAPVNLPPDAAHSGAVYIEIKLQMTWREFCNHENTFRLELVNIVRQNAQQDSFSMDQIRFLESPSQACALWTSQRRQLNEEEQIEIQLYLVNKSYVYDVTLTIVCSRIIKRGFELMEESLFKNRLMLVQLHELSEQDGIDHTPTPATVPVGNVNNNGDDDSFISAPGVMIVLSIAIVGGICCAALIIIQQVMVRRRLKEGVRAFNRSYSITSVDSIALNNVSKSRPSSGVFNPALDLAPERLKTKSLSHPLNFTELANFTLDLEAVYEEFQMIPNKTPRLSVVPVGAEEKNRFANILPIPSTRVHLDSKDGDDVSSYINANYVSGYNGQPYTYIATQAPLDSTVADFWSMIWQQQTTAIIMLINPDENGHKKCATYFPDSSGPMSGLVCGDFSVTLTKRDIHQEYITSWLQVKLVKTKETRNVRHFWLTCWPVSGRPDPVSLVRFVLDSRPQYEDNGAPVVVHCSNGTGRTGVFIALDICMRQYEDRRTVDVKQSVNAMRQERAGCIQTSEQYSILYQAISEYATILSSPGISASSSAMTLTAILP